MGLVALSERHFLITIQVPNYPILEVQIKNSINTKLNFKATFSMFKEN